MSISSLTVGSKIKYKLVLLGDQHVGKTSIIDRFINNRYEQSYNVNYYRSKDDQPTIGIDFLVRNILHNNKTYRLQLWDTAGQERFKSLIPSYLKDSNCALIVYDVNNKNSLQNTIKWLKLYNEHKENDAICVLVGNKIDISSPSCSIEVIKKKQKQLNLIHFQISAKTNHGIQELFLSIIDLIAKKLAEPKIIDFIIEKQNQEQDNTVKPVQLKIKLEQCKKKQNDQSKNQDQEENTGKQKCCN